MGREDQKPLSKVSKTTSSLPVFSLIFFFVRMVEKVKKHDKTLGQTGQGIRRKEDIDLTKKNEFVNKWGEWSFSQKDE